MKYAICLASLLIPTSAMALPQFAVRSSRTCNNCHVSPAGWSNPEVSKRRCTLSCTACHVNPTGGGMRKVGGHFYGKEILPMFGARPNDQPMKLGQRPSTRPSAGPGEMEEEIPEALSSPRYAGMQPFPFAQLGTDLRLMFYRENGDNAQTSVFPMQIDGYLALRPYNPQEFNKGRLTLLANVGFLGSRDEQFDGFIDRAFVREWWALFDDLPYQGYVKVGRFLPAYGWRLDDHTPFIRQEQTLSNQDQVTGVELGVNPNYLYAHASFYNATIGTDRWKQPIRADDGFGTTLSAGYRELLWQAGGSFRFDRGENQNRLWAGANWSLNLHDATDSHRWKGLDWIPLIYLGEFDVVRRSPRGGGRAVTGLVAFHEIDVLIMQGLNAKLRYDWEDADIELVDNERHRYTVGVEWHPYTYVEVIAQYRHNAGPGATAGDEFFLQLHGWY